MIAKDIEKGDYLEQKIGLKDEQILNLQAQVSVRDSVILAEQEIRQNEHLVHRKALRSRTLQSFVVGGTSSAVLLLLLFL